MLITLERKIFTLDSTVGILSLDGKFFCYTLEDRDRQWVGSEILPWTPAMKVPKQTAIPYGGYEVIINYSSRFKKRMPLILNVPNYEGVRIHVGNTSFDTEGCIIVGCNYDIHKPNYVGESKVAFNSLFTTLDKAVLKEKVVLQIKNFWSKEE